MPNFRLFTNLSPSKEGVTFVPDLGDHFQIGRRGQFDFGFRGSGGAGFSIYYMRPYNLEDKDMLAYDEDKVRDAFQYTVADLVSRKGSSFELMYDFGDSWKHKVTCLGKRKRSGIYGMQDPVVEVLSGEGCCPPDDCGGTYGYRDLLSTMADPSNEEYESMKGWLQGVWGYGDFDPLAFDLHSCRLRVDDYQRLIEEVRRGLFRRG